MSDSGFILQHRKVIDWEWYTTPHMYHLFTHLILRASWKNNRFRGQDILRGQAVTGLKKLSVETGISIQSLRTCLNRLKATGEITVKSTSKFSIITICNYEYYQDKKITANKPLTNHQQSINNTKQGNKGTKEQNYLMSFPLTGTDGGEFQVSQDDHDQWQTSYPAVDVLQELRNCRQWNIDNPTRRKTPRGIRRHIGSWLERKQNSGGTKTGNQKRTSTGPRRHTSIDAYKSMMEKIHGRNSNNEEAGHQNGNGSSGTISLPLPE